MTQLTVKILMTQKKNYLSENFAFCFVTCGCCARFPIKTLCKENIESQKYEKFTTRIAESDPMTFGDSRKTN